MQRVYMIFISALKERKETNFSIWIIGNLNSFYSKKWDCNVLIISIIIWVCYKGKDRLYKQPGATETAAMKSAEGNVQEKNYEATFPVMYNILGQPTYVSSLKDKAGLVTHLNGWIEYNHKAL